MFKATIQIADKKWEAEGSSSTEAFRNLPFTLLDAKLKGIVTLESGKKKTARVIFSKGLKRFAANKLIRLQTARNFEKLLSERDVPQIYKVLK